MVTVETGLRYLNFLIFLSKARQRTPVLEECSLAISRLEFYVLFDLRGLPFVLRGDINGAASDELAGEVVISMIAQASSVSQALCTCQSFLWRKNANSFGLCSAGRRRGY